MVNPEATRLAGRPLSPIGSWPAAECPQYELTRAGQSNCNVIQARPDIEGDCLLADVLEWESERTGTVCHNELHERGTESPTTGDSDETLLVPAETVAKMLSISVRSLWRLLSAGRLVPPVRLGRSVRWRVTEVRRWIDAGCPPPSEFSPSTKSHTR